MIRRFQKQENYGPVTAVAFYGLDILLVGQGPVLKKYNWKTGDLLDQKNIFKRNKLHGIDVTKDDKIVVWGGRSLAVLEATTLEPYDKGERCLNEWIMYVTWTFDSTRLLIQTAHNSLITVDIEHDFTVVAIDGCAENSVLYSGTICPLESQTLVAAGTVLGGVVIWSLETHEIVHKMTSHEGSIFYVQFSPSGRYLSSCSDDRCIKLWDVDSGVELATGWGHTARIWTLHFLDENTLLSTSEDCTSRIWSYSESLKTLNCIDILEGHRGRSVWCGSIDYQTGVFASGGADAQVLLYDLETRAQSKDHMSLRLAQLEEGESLEKNETFKKFARLGQLLVVTTTTGRVFVTDLQRVRNNETVWEIIDSVPRDVYTMIRSLPLILSVCVGVRYGTLTFIQFSSDQSTENTTRQLKVEGLKGQLSNIYDFSNSTGTNFILVESQRQDDDIVIVDAEGTFPQLKLKRPSAFAVQSIEYDKVNQRLYLGSGNGAVAFYYLAGILAEGTPRDAPIDYTSCWRRLMSTEPVTSVAVMPKSWSNSVAFTSSDGQFTVISVDNDGSYTRLMWDRLPKGNIEGSRLIENTEKESILYLAAFRQDQFFLYNANEQMSTFSQRCGGARREWDLMAHRTDGEDQFEMMYIKTGTFHRVLSEKHKHKFSNMVLQHGVHGREIRAISVSPRTTVIDGQEALIVATSSEDTTIKFSTFQREIGLSRPAVFKAWSSQRKHISGIPQISWTPDGQFLLSCSAQEQLMVWKVSDLQGRILAVPFAQLPTSTSLPDLRVMAFTFIYDYPDKKSMLLANVYSDSTIKVWTVDMNSGLCKLNLEWRYTGCCLLNSDFLSFEENLYLAVSATDGSLVLWDISSFGTSPAQALKLQLHQSSVKSSFLVKSKEDGIFHHFSAGDDNAITIALLDLRNTASSNILTTREDAHSCTITSILELNGPDSAGDDSIDFVTTGTDQNVRLWNFTLSTNSLQLIDSAYTTIADTGCLATANQEYEKSKLLFIGGAGLSYWKVVAPVVS